MGRTRVYQLPDPTTVTLCFCSCAPRVAMVRGVVDIGRCGLEWAVT